MMRLSPRQRPAAMMLVPALVGTLIGSAAGATCETCRLTLTTRTGPYAILARKAGAEVGARRASMRVTIVNRGFASLVVGAEPRFILKYVTPAMRGRETLSVVPNGEIRRIGPGTRFTFRVWAPVQLRTPGVYRFNISYGGVDSNVVTYTVRSPV